MTHSKMRLIVASNNSNKLREFHEILGERFDIVSMHEAGIDADIEENGTTFEENALIKANYVMNACQDVYKRQVLHMDAINCLISCRLEWPSMGQGL